ncbi:hypothetical protein V6N13_133766 [Hibiscus sabdariffa]
MVGLEELCNGLQPHGFLQNLKTFNMFNCEEMVGAIPIIQNLEELKVKCCDKMQVLFQIAEQGPTHHFSLQSLKVVEIYGCDSLKYLFPVCVVNSLGQLQTLKLRKCRQLEEIIQQPQATNIRLQSLREVHVEECDHLTSLSSLSNGQRLEKLTSLSTLSCLQLEYTFPISMNEGLPLLNEVWLVNLPEFRGRDGNDIVLTLPSLHAIAEQGPNRHFNLQSLKVVEIYGCDSLKYMFPMCVANSLGQLQTLNIRECSQLKDIIQQPHETNICLQSLKVVKIEGCDSLKYLFPMCVANGLGQLQTLKIRTCRQLEEIIQQPQATNICLQSLRKVSVRKCNKLTSLSSLSHGQIMKNLTSLFILDCPQLEYTFPISMADGLPLLNEVSLVGLPEFKGRDGHDIVLTLPSLHTLKVQDCPQLTPFIISAHVQVRFPYNTVY